jgi:ubiquinone/menaquinone biosynthesis C-methylase UbiE
VNRLTGVTELLDGDLTDRAALVGNLRDLARINRLTGGTQLSRRAIAALAPVGDLTLLDVGTGGADIPASLLADAAGAGRSLHVTAVESRPEVIDAAVLARGSLGSMPRLRLETADGRSLPYPDASFGVAHASLVLHHLDPDDAVSFLRELRRVARDGVVVNDLVRGRLAWIGAWVLVHTIATSRFTRHDGPLSVRRAYSRSELVELLRAAGLEPVATFDGFARHRIAIAAR